MDKQYIVNSKDISERETLYNYLMDNGYQPVENFKHQEFINNTFPFVIESNQTFWICESITCCAAASSCNAIITIYDFFDYINDKKKLMLIK